MPARFLALLLFCAGLLTACSDPAPIDPGQVEWRDVQLLRERGGPAYLSGKLVNLTAETIPSVQVQVYFYDDQNTRVDEMVFPVRDLEPGEEVAFREAVDSDADVQRAGIVAILRL